MVPIVLCLHEHACGPLANIGRMSGLPQHQVCLLSLKTESNSTGFSFQPEEMNIKSQMNLLPVASTTQVTQHCTPTFSNSTDIFIEASDESNMTWTGFCGDACVRHPPGTLLFDHTPGKHTQGCRDDKRLSIAQTIYCTFTQGASSIGVVNAEKY